MWIQNIEREGKKGARCSVKNSETGIRETEASA
jgi:hypothetical protein